MKPQANAAAMSAAVTAFLAAYSTDGDAEAAYTAAEAAYDTAIAAERLAYGRWERETDACKEHGCGRPWGAKVGLAGAKLKFNYRDVAALYSQAGMISIPCAPGDVIAWGPNDMRRASTLLVMLPSGQMRKINRTEAVRHLRGH